METKKFQYGESIVNFEITNKNVMVNATEMAKIFDAKVNHFMENESTKRFIEACLKNRNSGFIFEEKTGKSRFFDIEKEKDLYVSRQKSGTWMHRILALKFAAWLNPEFEVWVYSTIDEILFGEYAELEAKIKESANRKVKIKLLRDDIEKNPPEDKRIKELIRLENEDKKDSRKPFSEIGRKVKNEYQQLITQYQETAKC